jgi:serine/threonine protein kinase
MRPIELPPEYRLHPDIKVTHEVGRGGLSIVYALVDQMPDMPDKYSALKILSPDPRFQSDPRLKPRFRLEQWLTNRFLYKHLLTGGFGENKDFIYIKYNDLCSGDLKGLIRGEEPYPEPEKLFLIMCDILFGVAFLHANGIVHRDLKPNNILLLNKRAVVSDYGIARDINKTAISETATSDIVGSRDYIAPEQRINPRAATVASDIYSLGVIFYEVVTRQLPIYHYEPVREITPAFAFLDDILPRMMARDPAQRFGSVPDVACSLALRWTRLRVPGPVIGILSEPYHSLLWAERLLNLWPDIPLSVTRFDYRLYMIEDLIAFYRYWLGLFYNRILVLPVPTLEELRTSTPIPAAQKAPNENEVVDKLKDTIRKTVEHDNSIFELLREASVSKG